MTPDFFLNGQGNGTVATRLINSNMNPLVLRPCRLDDAEANDPRSYIAVDNKRKDKEGNSVLDLQFVGNSVATLKIREWIELDEAVQRIIYPRLKAVGDLRSAGLTYNISNGLAKTVLQYQRVTNSGKAKLSMDGLNSSPNDRPEYDTQGIPLPLLHSDFSFSARDIAVSRNGNDPLDTHMAEEAARKIADAAEQMLLGTGDFATFQYAAYNIYGYTNFPSRHTYTLADPAGGGYVPKDTINDLLAMKQVAINDWQYGPFFLYNSPAWEQYLDNDYTAAYNGNTLRNRISQISGIASIQTLDFLTGTQMLLVQKQSNTVRLLNGMDITTVQWEEQGGMEVHFKILACWVPHIRTADITGKCGIVHGSI